jgi:hypothetical protein
MIENVLLKEQVIIDNFVVTAKLINGSVVVTGRKENKFAVSQLLLNQLLLQYGPILCYE